jgi:hypothetical protein
MRAEEAVKLNRAIRLVSAWPLFDVVLILGPSASRPACSS